MEIVIDKSYLQGAPAKTIRSLCEEHIVLFSETLLYEILTSDKLTRDSCFAKLPLTDNPVVLIPRIGPLIRYEIEYMAASRILDHQLEFPYRFNPRFRDHTFRHSAHEEATLHQWQSDVDKEVLRFRNIATSLSVWCPALKSVSGEELKNVCRDLKKQACRDLKIIRMIYRDISPVGFPPDHLLGPAWALFRWVQTKVLFALDYLGRYGFGELLNIPKRVEHDIHDSDYVAFGALSGTLATRDNDIAYNFLLCYPDGRLLS